MHEIITIQLGQAANYLATHFWNTQESYQTFSPDSPPSPINHDILFRQGLSADNHTETFLPRTLIYDLSGGFGSLRASTNPLYAPSSPSSSLPPSHATTIHTSPPIPPSPYTAALDSGVAPPALTPAGVRYWSDYSRVYYHPRSIVQINEYELGSGTRPFESFGAGEELFGELDKEHDLLDRDLRLWAEEADTLQGLQVWGGMEDGWGGFMGRYLERVRDEYGKVGIWVWGVGEEGGGGGKEKKLLRLANKARALTEAYKSASIVVPLAVPRGVKRGVVMDYSSQWHTSALMAAAVESATLPSRLKDAVNRDTLDGMAATLNAMGKQTIAGLQMSVDAADEEEADRRDPDGARRKTSKLTEEEENEGVKLSIRFTPSDQLDPGYGRRNGFRGEKSSKVFSQLVAMRGYPAPEDDDGEAMDLDEDDRARRRYGDPSVPITKSYTTDLRFPLLDSYPQMFRRDNGEALRESINVTSSLSTESSTSDRLKMLRTTVLRSIGIEDREMIGNDLADIADEYHEGWSSGSDEGDDD